MSHQLLRQTTKSPRLIPNTDTGLRNVAPKPKTSASIVECQPPEILVKIVKNHNKHLPWFEREGDMLTIPVHDLSKKFDVPEIVDAIYVRIEQAEEELNQTFRKVNEEQFDDHVVISPFGVHEMNSPRFREIKSKFMDFLEGLEYGIEDTMFRVKFDSKPIPYSLFSFQFPPARFDMASRLFSSYLTKGDEIIEAYIPGNNNQDSSMVAYFVVKLGSSQNPLNQVFNETVSTEVTVE
ncbi:uncharacterized protein J8A68_004782 [[Candida] subhashii]|uniref:Uncharacterized protein n=1 Tax=[Candida] subhashii TaxID=561895 RepID=A0A8J5Q577_9ASCO|nr:uncharacterized protein J8A68_004782 [[Candida] subhashii]KAG7661724.1 hypothetical protein J8A68_004782 [[Candida] subhashii]